MSGKSFLSSIPTSEKNVASFKIVKEMSINNIDAIKKEIDEVIQNNKKLHLKIEEIENFDLTAIQLLQALKQKLGKNFSVEVKLKKEQEHIITNAGLDIYLKNF